MEVFGLFLTIASALKDVYDLSQKGKNTILSKTIVSEQRTIADKIDKILDEVSSTFSSLPYPEQRNYIRRGIRNYDKADSLTYYLTPESYKVQTLVDYIIEDGLAKRIVLYSEAQAGKTTELRNLAHETQASGLFNTYLYDLKLFASGSLIDGPIIKYLTSDNSKRNLLILDGLDEVRDEIRPAAIPQIINLASAYPNLSIVVSCRGNFESTNEIAGFTKLYLNPLSLADVEAHVDPPKLFDEIKRKELYELVYNPFYLKAIKEHYDEKGSLPETKSDIYDYVIDKSLQAEEKRFTGHSLIRVRELTLPLLQKMAFCMQLTEKSFLPYEELTKGLSFSEKQVEDCTRYSIFKMDDEGNYGFVHNAFKEYLTAKHLSKMSFDQLKAVIAFPGTDLLRPNLYNTVLLLVSVLKEGDPLVRELIDWIAEHNTDVLFMCEHHFLSEARSAEILKRYLEYLKKYGEYISYQLWDKAMTFSNTRETILYLLEEAKKEKQFSSHQSNIVALLQYADMSKLSEAERDDVYDFGIKLIRQNRDTQDSQYALFHIPRNEYFKTPKHIARLHSAIKESENLLLLLEVFKLIHSSGLSDEYFDWVVSKREPLKSPNTNGVIHIIDTEPYIDILTSVKKIDNVLNAIKQHDFISRVHVHFRGNNELVAQIFANLNAVPEADVNEEHIGTLLNILRFEHLIHHSLTDITDEIIKGCRKFFINSGFAEKIFTQSCDELKAELAEETRGSLLECLNVISTLMTDEHLDKIINDFDPSVNQNFLWLFFHLSNGYEMVKSNDKWRAALESVVAKYQPPKIDFAKRAQEGFNILFDHDRFVNEVEQVAEKYEALPTEWEYRGKLLHEGINESVIDFVWEYRTPGDEEGVVMAEVVSGAKNAATFNAFIFDQLNKYTNQNLQNLTISEEQSLKISSWITDWVNNIDSGTAQDLVKLIGVHPVKLSDDRLLSLLPCSFLTRNDRSLLRHIYDNISDKKLVIAEIDRILSGNEVPPLLIETFAEFIVSEKIIELYKHFEKMMFSNVWRPVIMDKMLELGKDGVKIIDPFKAKLNEKDRLTYYEMAARRDLLKFYDDSEIIADLHKIYRSVSDSDKITAIVLLSKYGDEKGLQLALEHYKNDIDCFDKEYPSLTSYGDEHVETIKQLFEVSHTSSVKPRNIMLEITSTWLDSYAMKSVENRDHIIDYYIELSETNPTIYSDLFRQAKNIRNKYYQKTTSNMSIATAIELYDRISA